MDGRLHCWLLEQLAAAVHHPTREPSFCSKWPAPAQLRCSPSQPSFPRWSAGVSQTPWSAVTPAAIASHGCRCPFHPLDSTSARWRGGAPAMAERMYQALESSHAPLLPRPASVPALRPHAGRPCARFHTLLPLDLPRALGGADVTVAQGGGAAPRPQSPSSSRPPSPNVMAGVWVLGNSAYSGVWNDWNPPQLSQPIIPGLVPGHFHISQLSCNVLETALKRPDFQES